MKLLGFNFKKINIEKFSDDMKDLKIGTHIDLSEIESITLPFFKGSEEVLNCKFIFNLDYEPKIAKIELKGTIIIAVEPKLAKTILKDWKDKKISDDFKLTIFNLILRKSHLKSLQLEEEMNLPLHFKLPSLEKQKENKE